MRILHIRFKNLNSLAGEWEVDLEDPAIEAEGIFAITGPTGAGKSTILDAVCLALFGRTPRLDRITTNSNEIMSRQTGECFAEILFETRSGRFRCHWAQHRARKKPSGDLQQARHEIAEAASGKILATGIREVGSLIQEICGMDFDRFSRSMLLAQGDFAVFLQAPPSERAPLLEQITGTEIYSRISTRVHERSSEEKKILEKLQAEMAGMQLMSMEDEERLRGSLEKMSDESKELTRKISGIEQAIAWLEKIAGLEESLKELSHRHESWKQLKEAFSEKEEKLKRATTALELDGLFAALKMIREEHKGDHARLIENQKILPEREKALGETEEQEKLTAERLKEARTEQREMLPKIRATRDLDLKIHEKMEAAEAMKTALAEKKKSLESLEDEQKKVFTALEQSRKLLEELLGKIRKNRTDEALVENLAGIRERFESLKEIHERWLETERAVGRAEKELGAATLNWKELRNTLKLHLGRLETSKTALSETQKELETLLEGNTLPQWRKHASKLTGRRDLLADALEASGIISASGSFLETVAAKEIAYHDEQDTLRKKLKVESSKEDALGREGELLEKQILLLQRIESLETARLQLEDGEPCPLCGATGHPYAEGNLPAPDESRVKMEKLRVELKTISEARTGLMVRQAEVARDLDQLASKRREHQTRISRAKGELSRICEKLDLDTEDPGITQTLEQFREETTETLERAEHLILGAETTAGKIETLRESLDKIRETCSAIEKDALNAEHGKDSAEKALEDLKRQRVETARHREEMLEKLRENLKLYGIDELSIDTLDLELGQLSARRSQWQEDQNAQAKLDRKIAGLDREVEHNVDLIRGIMKEHEALRLDLSTMTKEYTSLLDQRRELFGKKQPEKEEKRLSDAVDSAEKKLELARSLLQGATEDVNRLRSIIGELETSISERAGRLQGLGENFLEGLKESGFSDEEDFKAARLDEEERKILWDESKKLADQHTKITTKTVETRESLEAERAKKLSEVPRDKLLQASGEQKGAQAELQQQIGGIRTRLKDNETLKEGRRTKAEQLEAQQIECARWSDLHELIGSADGKKFRNFAQGLTFEIMVGHANRQLQEMSDRYLLVRDETEPLELRIIDNYQAGEIRSTKNLSGGESFIVSLALALGLAQMAGSRIRVDSLFLDEGFGTLDEEALDTALGTLAALHHDGKLIGIISHVSALKERISARIEVSPQNGGRSKISGPGCRQIAS